MGTAPSGVRSESVEAGLTVSDANVRMRDGEDVKMAVEDVGTGVGYVVCSSNASRFRLRGLGKAGEDENGSNAGNREVAGLLEPGVGEAAASGTVVEGGMACCALSYLERDSRRAVVVVDRLKGASSARQRHNQRNGCCAH